MGFSYDNANRLTSVVNSVYLVQTRSCTYDSVDRLTNMTGTAPLDLTYDASGNRSSQDGQAGGTTSIASGSNRLLARGVHTYAYDARGDRTQDAVSGSTLAYTYDGFGRLRTASRTTLTTICQTFNACPTYPAGTMTYSFSARGQRMSKSDPNGESMWYSYLPNGQLSSTLSNKSGYNYYIYLAGQPIGLVRNPLVYDVNTLYFIHADRMGRPESITDASQTKQWTALNFAFDSALFWEGAVAGIDIGLPGQVYDAETGNWSNGFRDYDSSNGRYLESDPIGLGGGMNTYAYVGNNPLSGVDPLGLANLLIGPNVSAIAVGGFTLAGGVYIHWGEGGFDAGLYGSAGMGIGVNIGTGVGVGYVPGSTSNITGTTLDLNGTVGSISGTASVAVDPSLTPSGFVAASVGLPVGAALTATHTGHYGWQDAKRDIGNLFQSGSPSSGNPCPAK